MFPCVNELTHFDVIFFFKFFQLFKQKLSIQYYFYLLLTWNLRFHTVIITYASYFYKLPMFKPQYHYLYIERPLKHIVPFF